MAPACHGDESFEKHVDSLVQSRTEAEIGLLVGRSGKSGRATILSWLPTPHGDSIPVVLQHVEEKPGKKQKKPEPDMQLQLAVTTIVEHSIQIAAMLPGGLSVFGVYLFAHEAAFTNATHQMCQILDGMTTGAATAADKLLFISSHPTKFLCKHRSTGTPSSAALAVCDFKLGPMLSGFSTMTCRYQALIKLPVLDNTQQLSSHVEAAISAESQRIQQSIGSIQGTIATSSTLVADMQQPLMVDMLSPPACCCIAEQRDTKEASVSGRVLVEGVLHGRAMVNKKDTLAAAVELLKADLIGSLQARVDLLMAEADELLAGDVSAGAPMLTPPSAQPDAPIIVPLPARVFFPVQQVLSFSDYLATGESFAEMSDRLQPLLGCCAKLHEAEFPEGTEPSYQITTDVRKWDPQPKTGDTEGWLGLCSNFTLVTSVTAALVAGGAAVYLGR